MTQLADIRNLLQRDGTSQGQRTIKALNPAFVKVDERDIEAFLVFSLRFARQVIYYDLTNKDAGDWTPFFGCDTSVLIASIEKTNKLIVKQTVAEAVAAPPTAESLETLFTLLIDLARQIDDWQEELASWSGLKDKISKLIKANLSTFMGRLVGFEKAAVNQLSAYDGFDAHRYTGFGDEWNLGDPNAVVPDTGLFGGGGTEAVQIKAAQETLDDQFTTLYNVFLEIIGLAATYFDASITKQPDHEPHIALFIAFLHLYLQVRDDANKITERHLDFFYKDVLRLKTKDPVPDSVHLFFKLARQKDEYEIDAGTGLKAGKDATGVARVYALDDDLVANIAQIDRFRTVFVEYDREDPAFPTTKTIKRVYAAPVANSQDGLGAEIEDTDRPSWKTLGSAAMPAATLGFAIASQALSLAEGTREITLSLHCDNLSSDLAGSTALSTAFSLAFSGEKAWIEPEADSVTVTLSDEEGAGVIAIVVTLQPTDDPITAFDAKALGEDYGTTLPLVKVLLRQPPDATASFAYQALKDLALRRVTIALDVDKVQNVIVENDLFVMDAAKPFQPFGPLPEAGANFYVGSGEVFAQKLTKLDLNIEWDALPSTFAAHYEGYYVPTGPPATTDFEVVYNLLQDAAWETIGASEDLFLESSGTLASARMLSLNATDLAKQDPRAIDAFGPRDLDSQNGFLRLTLTPRDFYHSAYATVLTRQALAAGKLPKEMIGAQYKKTDGTIVAGTTNTAAAPGEVILPNEPYTPTIKSFSLDYEASLNTKDDHDKIEFIHILPFGYERVVIPAEADVSGDDDQDTAKATVTLVPQFDDEGTLYLGLKDLEPLQSLSVLFQVAESTADTDLEKAEVKWSYLAGNGWTAFEDYEITSDTTQGLIASGIIIYTMPRAISSTNTRLPATNSDGDALYWIKAAVSVNAGAVSELINAHTQAVKATFADNKNDPDHLKTPLLAKTISKLVKADAAIDSVSQLYDSFGGQPAEKGLSFYTRISERLRHKGRAITLFDYERLVLEQFPGIYKVKCINHSNDQHALAPGHVLIAVIPDFTDLKAVDRRVPKVTFDTLDDIKAFLRSVNCPFVRCETVWGDTLHVRNPIYEDVTVDFKVKFMPKVTAIGFHVRTLNDAIIRFLSPWAFEEGAEINFGGKVYKSSILNFVEEQDYVDYVADFKMMHNGSTDDVDEIQAGTPRSILIPADEHKIEALVGEYCVLENVVDHEGIGQMTVDQDFEID